MGTRFGPPHSAKYPAEDFNVSLASDQIDHLHHGQGTDQEQGGSQSSFDSGDAAHQISPQPEFGERALTKAQFRL
jgi:hypothetical protein